MVLQFRGHMCVVLTHAMRPFMSLLIFQIGFFIFLVHLAITLPAFLM